jgi:hypothetical protein
MLDTLLALLTDPVYFLLAVGGVALLLVLLVARHIHRIHSEEIFIHQAWGAKWKGR